MQIHFNTEVNISTVLTMAGAALGVLWRLHNWDKRTALMHSQNQARAETLGHETQLIRAAVEETRDEQKKCREAITDTRERVIRLEAFAQGGSS
jgi:hypothetical protein